MKSPLILDGKNLAKEIEAELKLRVQKIMTRICLIKQTVEAAEKNLRF